MNCCYAYKYEQTEKTQIINKDYLLSCKAYVLIIIQMFMIIYSIENIVYKYVFNHI